MDYSPAIRSTHDDKKPRLPPCAEGWGNAIVKRFLNTAAHNGIPAVPTPKLSLKPHHKSAG